MGKNRGEGASLLDPNGVILCKKNVFEGGGRDLLAFHGCVSLAEEEPSLKITKKGGERQAGRCTYISLLEQKGGDLRLTRFHRSRKVPEVRLRTKKWNSPSGTTAYIK